MCGDWIKQSLKIGSWNVITMAQTSKIDNAIRKIKCMKIEIMSENEI